MHDQTRTIETAGGHALHVSLRGAGGLPVLFINSVAADHRMWEAVRARMSRLNVAYDPRGHGQSEVTPGQMTVAGFAQDALDVMAATGLERAVLCGLSLGGLTAMKAAELAPERVAGLVLANTATSFPPPSLWQDRAAATRADGWPGLVQPTLERWLGAQWREANPEATGDVRAMLEAMPPEGYAAACHALETGDTTAALAGYAGPTLAIAGRHDLSAPVARSEELMATAQRGEMVVLDTAHIAAIEDAEGFAAALEGFVAGIEAADG
ncbi:MAG: alpha/beta fold hydrolase [Vannielia sp.]|uniref:alpha/beta fold hydrolase n=1 Tax=Vannielia sp. TaxID=2813045 RepID=UPI003B8ADF25